MAPEKSRTEALNEQPILPTAPTELAELGRKRVDAMMQIHKEMFDAFQKFNLGWFERTQSVVHRNAELMSKLTSARTISEATEACQQCIESGMKGLVEDGQKVIADGQKIMDLSMRAFTNGPTIKGGTT